MRGGDFKSAEEAIALGFTVIKDAGLPWYAYKQYRTSDGVRGLDWGNILMTEKDIEPVNLTPEPKPFIHDMPLKPRLIDLKYMNILWGVWAIILIVCLVGSGKGWNWNWLVIPIVTLAILIVYRAIAQYRADRHTCL